MDRGLYIPNYTYQAYALLKEVPQRIRKVLAGRDTLRVLADENHA